MELTLCIHHSHTMAILPRIWLGHMPPVRHVTHTDHNALLYATEFLLVFFILLPPHVYFYFFIHLFVSVYLCHRDWREGGRGCIQYVGYMFACVTLKNKLFNFFLFLSCKPLKKNMFQIKFCVPGDVYYRVWWLKLKFIEVVCFFLFWRVKRYCSHRNSQKYKYK